MILPFSPEIADMGTTYRYNHEVEAQLKNVELRNALEPYLDESVNRVFLSNLTLDQENEYLSSMLAWEKANIIPVYRWFSPELCPPRPSLIQDCDLSDILEYVIQKLYDKHIVLEFTDHLSDRELYTLIWRDILPSEAKLVCDKKDYISWDCAHINGDPETWLRYYASEEERQIWADAYEQTPPPAELPTYPRHLPENPTAFQSEF